MANRRSQATALIVRGWVAALLASRSQLDPPWTDKELRAACGGGMALITIRRARLWVREAHASGRLPALIEWKREANRGPLPEWRG
jgi:hypothetical protein